MLRFTDDKASGKQLTEIEDALIQELTQKPKGVISIMFGLVHNMAVKAAQSLFEATGKTIYINAIAEDEHPRCSSYAQMVCMYYGIFDSKITHLHSAIDRLAKAIAHSSATTDEMERWLKDKLAMEKELTTLMADCLVYAAFVVYFSAFPPCISQRLVAECIDKCKENQFKTGEEIDMANMLCEDAHTYREPESQTLHVTSLPWRDPHTRNLAIAVEVAAGEHSNRCPLLVDPSGLATKWLSTILTPNGLIELDLTMDHVECLKQLTQGAKNGNSVIMKLNTNTIPSCFLPFLDRIVYDRDAALELPIAVCVAGPIATRTGCIHPSFKLYFVSTLNSAADLHPSVFQYTNVTYFGITTQSMLTGMWDSIIEGRVPQLMETLKSATTKVAMYTRLLRTVDKDVRVNLCDPGRLVNSRKRFDLIRSKLESSVQQADNVLHASERDAYMQIVRAASQIFVVLKIHGNPIPFETFGQEISAILETLQDSAIENMVKEATDAFIDRFGRDAILEACVHASFTETSDPDLLVPRSPSSNPAYGSRTDSFSSIETESMSLSSALNLLKTSHATCYYLTEEDIQELLSHFTSKFNEVMQGLDLLLFLQAQINVLRSSPSTLSAFTEHKMTVKAIRERLPNYMKTVTTVHSELCVAVANKQLTKDDLPSVTAALQLLQAFSDVKSLLLISEGFIESQNELMIGKLEDDLQLLLGEIEVAGENVNSDEEARHLCIHQFRQKLDTISNQAKSLCQGALNVHSISVSLLLCKTLVDDMANVFAALPDDH